MKKSVLFADGLVASALLTLLAATGSASPTSAMPEVITLKPQEAYRCLQQHTDSKLFVDVRTRAEVNMLGTSSMIDANIPFLQLSDGLQWDPATDDLKMTLNFEFIPMIREALAAKQLDKSSWIILIGRDGERSLQAAKVLTAAGFSQVAHVLGGYEGELLHKYPVQRANGWRQANLP